MDTLPQELFSYIVLLLEAKDRLACALVNKCWSTKIRQGTLLYNAIHCTSLVQNAGLMRHFNENPESRHRVKTMQYHLIGRLSISQIKSLSQRFWGIRHFQYYVCENNIARHLRQQSILKPLDLKNLHTSYRQTNIFDTKKYKIFDGWPNLQSIEETSDCMYTLFILKNTQKPFSYLTRLWLNFVHISMADKMRATDQLVGALINSPNLKELTVMNAQLNLDHLDLMSDDCKQLQFLSLERTRLYKYRSFSRQEQEEKPFIIDYYSKSDMMHPVRSLRVLRIVESNFEEGLPIFSYIAENYTDLRELVCEAQVVGGNPTFAVDERSARELIHHSSKLEKFESNLFSWTGRFIDLIDQHTTTIKEEFDLDISDIAVSTFIALCRSNRLCKALKKFTYNFNQVPESFDSNILKFSGLVELNLNYDCFLDDEADEFNMDDEGYKLSIVDDEDMSVPPAIPFVSLLEACTSLKSLSVGHLPIHIDKMPTMNHDIQVIQLTGCSLESFNRRYSFYNYVSDRCYELETLEIEEGNYRCYPSTKELTLNLYKHTKLHTLVPLHNRVYHYVKHLDQDGTNDWYIVRRKRFARHKEIYYTLLTAPSYDMVKSGKYVTIMCQDADIFYRGKEGFV
ncbi:hypothetical protein PS15m_004750 [Mucor circinelloides]